MSIDVDGDGADGPVFDFVVEPAFGEQLIELAAALRDLEPAVLHLLQSVFRAKSSAPWPDRNTCGP